MEETAQRPLVKQLARAEAIKANMTELLLELESRAAGKPVDVPGRWRHRQNPSAKSEPLT